MKFSITNIKSNNQAFSWPPPYTLRQCKRSKNIHFKISPEKGLEIVVPNHFRRFNILNLLEEQREWIQKNLASCFDPQIVHEKQQIPRTLDLMALNELWHIIYIQSSASKLKIKQTHKHVLLMYGQKFQTSEVHLILRKWLKKYAKEKLGLWLEHLASATKLNYTKLQIRGQKTMWGSCNEYKHISLNYKILFLPSKLAKHILLHELCHLRHLDHSKAFWNLLAQFDSNTTEHRHQLKQADQHVPTWLRYLYG